MHQLRVPNLCNVDETEGDTLSRTQDKVSEQALCSKKETTRCDAALTRPGDPSVLSGFWHKFCSK